MELLKLLKEKNEDFIENLISPSLPCIQHVAKTNSIIILALVGQVDVNKIRAAASSAWLHSPEGPHMFECLIPHALTL